MSLLTAEGRKRTRDVRLEVIYRKLKADKVLGGFIAIPAWHVG